MKILTLLCCLVLFNAVLAKDYMFTPEPEWKFFKAHHNKEYEPSEENFRFRVFLENRARIARHNKDADNEIHGFRLKMNKYGDLLPHEFVEKMNGFKHKEIAKYENGSTFLNSANVNLPESVDWREHGYVTPVKDQGHCGSCWSFSAIGALEGQHFRKTGKLVSLSEQNLVDCSTKFGNHGCNGGMMDNAFSYIKKNHGVDTEKSYPYEAKDGKCRFTKSHVGGTDTGFVDIEEGNEEKLKEALATVGPISVAIDAGNPSFQFYGEGVYDEPQCSSTELDHGVLAVGYGTTVDGKDYWLIKNSWGATWGDEGYIKIARNKNNLCGVASQASYPLV